MADGALEQAASEAAGGSGPARRRAYELVLQESLYVDAVHPSEPGGAVALSTTTRGGRLEMSVFSCMDRALTFNPDPDAYRVHAPATWIFSEAQRLGCAVVWLDSPQFEIASADFATLAQGLVPGDSPKAAPPPIQTPVPPPIQTPAPPPLSPRTPAPAKTAPLPPREDGPSVDAPTGRIPGGAQYYLSGVLISMPKVTAAYIFDLLMPGEPRMLCLGLRIDLPSSQWNAFIDAIDQLDEIPGFPDGLAVYPLNDELLEQAREVGIKIL